MAQVTRQDGNLQPATIQAGSFFSAADVAGRNSQHSAQQPSDDANQETRRQSLGFDNLELTSLRCLAEQHARSNPRRSADSPSGIRAQASVGAIGGVPLLLSAVDSVRDSDTPGDSGTHRRNSHSFLGSQRISYDTRTDRWVNTSFVPSEHGKKNPHVYRWRLWLHITVMSVLAGLITSLCCCCAQAIDKLTRFENFWGANPFPDSPINAYFVWRLFWQVVLAILAYSIAVFFTGLHGRQLDQYVGGSGIPEMKCQLAGIDLPGLFHWRTLVGKIAGLAIAVGGGLPVGFQGPFVHCAGCVSDLLMKHVPVFRPLLTDRRLKEMATVTSVAVGVACTFAAPIGGVLYALEVTNSFASLAYLHCFYGAAVASCVMKCARMLSSGTVFRMSILFETSWTSLTMNYYQAACLITINMAIGVYHGLLGAGFIRLHRSLSKYIGKIVTGTVRVRSQESSPHPQEEQGDEEQEEQRQAQARTEVRKLKRRLILVVAVAAFAHSVTTWQVKFFRRLNTQVQVINALSNPSWMSKLLAADDDPDASPTLLLCFLLKFFTTAFVLALPIPMGSVLPSFVIGALSGTLIAQVVDPFHLLNFQFNKNEPAYAEMHCAMAVIGACSFVAGTAHSFAQVIIVFELLAVPQILLSMIASSIAAIHTARLLEVDFWTSVIRLKKLPHLPSLSTGREALSVRDVMTTEFPVVPWPPTKVELAYALSNYPAWKYEVPVAIIVDRVSRGSRSPSMRQAMEVGRRRLVVLQTLAGEIPQLAPDQEAPDADEDNQLSEMVVVPLQVDADTSLKSLLPMLQALDKSVAFATAQDGTLIGAVSLTELYNRAIER